MESLADTAVETAPAEVENTAAEDTTSESVAEEIVYAGKYKSVEDLENGYTEMQKLYNSRYKGFTGAPENGEYSVTAREGIEQADVEAVANSPIIQRFKQVGFEQGMSNEMFNELMNDYVETTHKETQARIQEEVSKLGKNATERINNVLDRLSTILDGEKLEGIKSAMTTAASVEALEAILNRDVNTVAPKDTQANADDRATKEAELQKLWGAKDDRGRRKMEYDASYRNMVNKKFKDFYGD